MTAPTVPTAPSAPTVRAGRTLTLGGSAYPLVLPNIRDPRLHVASVIITIHVLGQLGLDFQVSVPQILAAIVTCAVLEVAITFRQSRAFVWPASAMLTGSGVALILRVVGTPPDDPWNTYAWYVFAIVAGLSLLSKYVIRYRGSHVFNPSNIGLVVTFVVLGSTRVEPLDFWWAPLNGWMILAYAVIIGGGLLITRRLRLLVLAASFWVTFAIGVGILSASGHCMAARWSFEPVCGADYWRVIVFSPEVLIFLFFMITDPKTAPGGQVGRAVFGVLVAVASVLLMAPQTDEFGTKVGLLAGLVVLCALRPILERILPAPASAADNLGRFAFGSGPDGDPVPSRPRRVARLGLGTLALLVVGVTIAAAGAPAREPVAPMGSAEILDRLPQQIDPSTFPAITGDVQSWDATTTQAAGQDILVQLAQNLELENQALLQKDPGLLTGVDHGDRLKEMQGRLQQDAAAGRTVIDHYSFDSVHVVLIAPFGVQTTSSLGLESRGTQVEETYDANGGLVDRQTRPYSLTFVVRKPFGDRWMNVAVQPGPEGG
jgi:Na+-translocating ferredoxin:NAD+ oxidoreductase RnfD subunit